MIFMTNLRADELRRVLTLQFYISLPSLILYKESVKIHRLIIQLLFDIGKLIWSFTVMDWGCMREKCLI